MLAGIMLHPYSVFNIVISLESSSFQRLVYPNCSKEAMDLNYLRFYFVSFLLLIKNVPTVLLQFLICIISRNMHRHIVMSLCPRVLLLKDCHVAIVSMSSRIHVMCICPCFLGMDTGLGPRKIRRSQFTLTGVNFNIVGTYVPFYNI